MASDEVEVVYGVARSVYKLYDSVLATAGTAPKPAARNLHVILHVAQLPRS